MAGSPRLERLSGYGDVRLFTDRPTTDDEKLRRAAGAQILINSRGAVKWPGPLLRALPDLRMIALCGIGTDSVDLEVARERGIVVSNIPGRTAPVVAEHALALLMAVARRFAFQTAELKAGRWTRRENVLLHGKTLGVIGAGAIGQQMIRLARAIGMNVIVWTYHPRLVLAEQLGFRYVAVDELLANSDAISLHVSLTDGSRSLRGPTE